MAKKRTKKKVTKKTTRSRTTTATPAEDKPGPEGWGDPAVELPVRMNEERSQLARAEDEHPAAFRSRPAKEISRPMAKAITEAHEKHALGGGGQNILKDSIDLRMIFVVLFGSLWMWPRQIIGSCVASGGMRGWGIRSCWEVAAMGVPEELIGDQRLSRSTIMPYAPYNYGVGRRLGNMRSGDGSYCSVHIKGFQRYGVVDCNTPKLHEIVKGRDTDYPEPQSASLYRDFGRHRHLDTLTPYAAYPLLESERITSADRSRTALIDEFKPHMICSGWGFQPHYQHRDGFWVYKRKGSWSHNMTIVGWFTASDGNEFVIVLNSWGPQAHRDGEIFVIPAELYDRWLRDASCLTIGDIDLPDSLPIIW